MPHFDMYKLVLFPSSFGLFLLLFSVMMPASLLLKETKTSPKYEQTEATYFFLITKESPCLYFSTLFVPNSPYINTLNSPST